MACKPRSFRRSSSGYAGCKTWTGYLQSTVEGLDDDGWVDGIGCRLWTENDRPLWATNLSWGYRCPSGVQAVTHCANHCHQNGWQVHSHEHPRSPGSVFGPFKRVFIGGAFQLINQGLFRHCQTLGLPRRFTWWDEGLRRKFYSSLSKGDHSRVRTPSSRCCTRRF